MSHHGLGTPDVTKLSLAVLISNMIYCTRSEELAYRKECMEEINRRFPHEEARLLDAVKGDKSSPQVTQNFDAQPELVICVDFGDLFMNINRMIDHCREGQMSTKDFQDLIYLRDIFQNPATIKHKSEAD